MENTTSKTYFESGLRDFKESVKDLTGDRKYIKLQEFQVLVAAVYSLIKHNDFVNIKLVDISGAAADEERVTENLLKNYGIKDKETAIQAIGKACFRGCQWQYTQFAMMDHDEFKEQFDKLSKAGQESFMKCKEFSDGFKELVGPSGYLAWDFALGTDMAREALFCDYFDERAAVEMLGDLSKTLEKAFDSWADFAVSFVAGGTYSAFKNSDFNELEAKKTFDYLLGLVDQLFNDDLVNVWKVYGWYKKKDYFPNLDKENLKKLLKTEQGCFVSDRVSVDGERPCFIYREEPFTNFPDSGWRFFAGDESKEYSADVENSNIFPLNVIANFDETIIPLLDAEVNTAFIRKEGENFINFKTVSDAMKEKDKDIK